MVFDNQILSNRIFYSRCVAGAAALAACLAVALPGSARPLNQPALDSQTDGVPVSQVNRPPEEGVPSVLTDEVRGVITDVNGNSITLRLENGETRTYAIPGENENRDGLVEGNEVVLTVARNTYIAVSRVIVEDVPVTATVRRRETVVQQPAQPVPPPAPRPAPAPAPAPAAQPAPQPVRAMW